MALTITLADGTGAPFATIGLSDAQEQALLHDLPGRPGIAGWLRAMVEGKAHACAKRMSALALVLVQAGGIELKGLADLAPATLVDALSRHPDYKDRAARDRYVVGVTLAAPGAPSRP